MYVRHICIINRLQNLKNHLKNQSILMTCILSLLHFQKTAVRIFRHVQTRIFLRDLEKESLTWKRLTSTSKSNLCLYSQNTMNSLNDSTNASSILFRFTTLIMDTQNLI